MRWCVRTNEILASNMTFTRLKVKQGHFETAILILHMTSSFITAKGVQKHNIEISLWFKRWVQWMWVLLQDISDLIRLSRTVQRTYFIIYEFCFTCFKVKCKRSYIFQSSSNETIIDFNSGVWDLYSINCGFRQRQSEYWKSTNHRTYTDLSLTIVFSKRSGLLHWLLAAKWRTCNSLFGFELQNSPALEPYKRKNQNSEVDLWKV